MASATIKGDPLSKKKTVANLNHTVTMNDIAKKAGCSQPAVSHALTGSGAGRIRMRPDRVAEIRRIAAEMGYKPNLTARQLAGKRSHMIGLVTNTLQTIPHGRMFAWIQHYAQEFGFHVMVAQTNDETDRIQQAVDEFNGRGVEGVIHIAYMNDTHWDKASDMLTACPNIVSVFGQPPVQGGYHIDVDVGEGAKLSLRHLVERDRRNSVLLLDDMEASWNRFRREGFEQAHRELGLDFRDEQVLILDTPLDWPTKDLDDHIDQLIADLLNNRQVDAILSDDGTIGILAAAFAARGIRVPHDVALLGHGNEVMVHFTYPRITTIDIMTRQVMEHAVRTLSSLISGEDGSQPQSVLLQPKLVVRDST